MAGPTRLLMIGEFRLLLEGLTSLLESRKEFVVVGSAADPEEAIVLGRSLNVDLVLIDAVTNKTGVISTLQRLKTELSNVKPIVVGLKDEDSDLLSFIEAGACGYVSTTDSLPDAVYKIESIKNQRAPCSPQIISSVFARIAELSRTRHPRGTLPDTLTQRETEVLRLIAAGLSNKEISEQLNITLNTVKNHVHNILEKLRVHRRREAIRRAAENGILVGSWPDKPVLARC